MHAQLPAVDIYLAELNWSDSTVELSSLRNITARPGYDNQPSFSPDNSLIYYTSIQDSVQADIFTYALQDGSTKQITHTMESEYSPVCMAGGKFFTTVRVEKDSAQRIWSISTNGKKERVLFQNVDSVGYYAMPDKHHLAFFKVTDIPTLVLAESKKQSEVTLDSKIGRCIKKVPGKNAISYLVKSDSVNWRIYLYHLSTGSSTLFCYLPAGDEDYVWYGENTLLMAHGNTIHSYTSGSDWKPLLTMPIPEDKHIFRLALSSDNRYLAFVAEE